MQYNAVAAPQNQGGEAYSPLCNGNGHASLYRLPVVHDRMPHLNELPIDIIYNPVVSEWAQRARGRTST